MRNIIKSNHLILFSLILSIKAAAPVELEQIHVGNVGQGNGISMLFTNEYNARIGVIIDAGSLEQHSRHPKFTLGKSWLSDYQEIIGPRIMQQTLEEDDNGDGDDQTQSSFSLTENYTEGSVALQHFGAQSNAENNSQNIEYSDNTMKLFFRNGTLQLDHLFVILSHPDGDHYNYIPDILGKIQQDQPNLPITALLSGAWRNNSLSTSTIHRLYQFNSQIILPFYGECIYGRNTPEKLTTWDVYNKIPNEDKTGFDAQIFQDFKPCYLGEYIHNVGINFQARQRANYREKRISVPGNLIPPLFIWDLNHGMGEDWDTNNQSAIISYTDYNKFNASFVFTGDASDDVFDRIADNLDNNGYSSENVFRSNANQIETLLHQYPSQETAKRHFVWLMVPHHGSDHNISETALELFYANGFIISAGTGSKFAHPGRETIETIMENRFHSEYGWQNRLALYPAKLPLPVFDEPGANNTDMLEITNDAPYLILSTLPVGSILFEPDSVKVENINTFTLEGAEYQMHPERRIWADNGQGTLPQKIEVMDKITNKKHTLRHLKAKRGNFGKLHVKRALKRAPLAVYKDNDDEHVAIVSQAGRRRVAHIGKRLTKLRVEQAAEHDMHKKRALIRRSRYSLKK